MAVRPRMTEATRIHEFPECAIRAFVMPQAFVDGNRIRFAGDGQHGRAVVVQRRIVVTVSELNRHKTGIQQQVGQFRGAKQTVAQDKALAGSVRTDLEDLAEHAAGRVE